MKYHNFLFLLLGGLFLTVAPGCSKDDVVTKAPAEPGIEFSPLTAYQEALPGSVVTFNMRVRTPDPVTGFSVRFKLPGSTDFVALPEYPDLSGAPAAAFSVFQTFEYTLPPSAAAIDQEVKFRFTSKTASTTYEKEYTVRMKSLGLQALRLWNSAASNYFKRNSLDLLSGVPVPADFPVLTKDMTELRSTTVFDGVTYSILRGWTSNNGTRFKSVTAAQYNAAATTYAGVYAGIAATSELQTLTTLGVASTGIGILAGNTYYIAKVNRNNVFSYVGIAPKKIPLATALPFNTAGDLDLKNEYLQIEIKK